MRDHRGFIKGALFGALLMLAASVVWSEAPGLLGRLSFGDSVWAKQKAAEKETENKLNRIEKMMDQYYLYSDDVKQEDLEKALYTGFVNAMNDPYTVYYDEEETKEIKETTTGEYSGIGAAMLQNLETGEVVISNVFQDSPAEKAGLKAEDILYQVDGRPVAEEDLNEVVTWIKGEKGTEVTVGVYRGEEREPLEVTAVRDTVETQTVEYSMKEGDTGYIYISEFDDVTYEQFKTALTALEAQGMQGLVIDLRNNPGGNLDTVVDMLRLILPEGTIVSVQDKYGTTETYECDGTQEFQKPLAVLVNEYSASASEIFAGAVQDYGTGKIVGVTTYGKGIVQELFDLGDGTMLKVTTAEYFTPNGENIHGKGIVPDVEVEYIYDESDPQKDNQLESALETVRE